eukprot:Gb_40965 [translate_table: standard]
MARGACGRSHGHGLNARSGKALWNQDGLSLASKRQILNILSLLDAGSILRITLCGYCQQVNCDMTPTWRNNDLLNDVVAVHSWMTFQLAACRKCNYDRRHIYCSHTAESTVDDMSAAKIYCGLKWNNALVSKSWVPKPLRRMLKDVGRKFALLLQIFLCLHRLAFCANRVAFG